MSQEEIAQLFGVSVDTIQARVWEETGLGFTEFQKQCKVSLRQEIFEKQRKLAIVDGHPGVLMRLGEIYCDQSDMNLKNRDSGETDKTFKIGFLDDESIATTIDSTTAPDSGKPEKI